MNRLTLGASILIAGLGIVSMTGCGTHVHGAGNINISPSANSANAPDHAANVGTGHTLGTVPAPANPADPGNPAPGSGAPLVPKVITTAVPTGDARFLSVSLTCVVTGSVSFPGEAKIPTYQPQLSWETANATGMALSIDNPGLVGSYGNYDWHGSIILGTGCYTDEGDHTIVLYTLGGTGPQAQRTIHEHGTMTKPTPPPFANPSPSPSGH